LNIETLDRFRGCLLGLACGDCVGSSVEFRKRGTFPPVTDMVGGGPFNLKPGEWTDDTSLSLALATSLIEKQGFDAHDQMLKYCRWMDHGYLSSTGKCFDIGLTISAALNRFKRTGDPFAGSTDPQSAGNGCVMKLAPTPMFYFPDRSAVIEYSGESSRTTHGAQECIDAARLFGAILYQALSGAAKETILFGHGFTDIESPKIQAIADGDYRSKIEDEIFSDGYVVHSLEAALWCFLHTDTFEAATLRATNLGFDSDSNSAICCQLAGAYYGESSIPAHWLDRLVMVDDIRSLADQLYEHSSSQ